MFLLVKLSLEAFDVGKFVAWHTQTISQVVILIGTPAMLVHFWILPCYDKIWLEHGREGVSPVLPKQVKLWPSSLAGGELGSHETWGLSMNNQRKYKGRAFTGVEWLGNSYAIEESMKKTGGILKAFRLLEMG